MAGGVKSDASLFCEARAALGGNTGFEGGKFCVFLATQRFDACALFIRPAEEFCRRDLRCKFGDDEGAFRAVGAWRQRLIGSLMPHAGPTWREVRRPAYRSRSPSLPF